MDMVEFETENIADGKALRSGTWVIGSGRNM